MLSSLEMSPRITLFVSNFFFSVSVALSIYILLPFLTTYMPEAYAGFALAAGSFAALLLFIGLPKWEVRYGAQRLVLGFVGIETLLLLTLTTHPGPVVGTLVIILMSALQPCVSYGLDLLLEDTGTVQNDAGRVRTIFLTAWNLGVFSAPILLALVLGTSNDYARVFLFAAGLLIPFLILLLSRTLPTPHEKARSTSHMRDTLVCIARDHDFSAVTFAHFLLYLFYMWAAFYAPIYLHNQLGFAWSSLGWVFAIMLIPYVVLEYPAGWIADHYLGDKELLFVGFLIAGGALALLSTLTSTSSLALILGILFMSRCGAALIEAMTEVHFFRRMTAQDINSMSFFRSTWPLAYTVGPLIASALLMYGDFRTFFLIVGMGLTLMGTVTTMLIKDVR